MKDHRFVVLGVGLVVAGLLVPCATRAEKVLVYDEEKGIVFVEKDSLGAADKKAAPAPKVASPIPFASHPAVAPVTAPTGKQLFNVPSSEPDIHVGRKKDPPEVYFNSGLEYFKNKDYRNALRNFVYADSLNPSAKFALWVGKTYRRMGKFDQMQVVMDRILSAYPDSDVADDALFELAFSAQVNGDYDKATRLYARLSEQYPFGVSFSNGEQFRDVAREQRQVMRSEMVSALNMLSYAGEDLESLYRQYQQAHNLPVTGKGDQATVSSVKVEYQSVVDKEAATDERMRRVKKELKWAFSLGAVLLVNCLVLVGLLAMARRKRRAVETLAQTLADLNVKSLQ